jgi:ubiquinone/menaquinone biosynthesis C-methylase UbiE
MKTTALLISTAALALTGCSAATKIDYWHLFSRAGWQHPDRVIAELGLQPGDRVADIGAGGGYFTFRLADAVGPTGHVYAVDVEEEKVRELEEAAREDGYSNITAVLGEFADPLLPDGEINLVFLCNTYHHIDEQIAYFDRLRVDLQPAGRVAIVEPTGIWLVRRLLPAHHWSDPEQLREQMASAHYRWVAGFDFLPIQSFEIFEVESD